MTLDLRAAFGDIDIYLFDQLLKGRVAPGHRVIDVGCGAGRNLVFFLQQGFDVRGCDPNPERIADVRRLAARLAPHVSPDAFSVASAEACPFEPASADLVVSSAVMHFARDHAHFDAMFDGMWRLLAPGGLLFCRLASCIGMADRMRPVGQGRCIMPDGTERYLVDAARLAACEAKVGAERVDPLKTTVVDNERCMTTWVVRRPRVS